MTRKIRDAILHWIMRSAGAIITAVGLLMLLNTIMSSGAKYTGFDWLSHGISGLQFIAAGCMIELLAQIASTLSKILAGPKPPAAVIPNVARLRT